MVGLGVEGAIAQSVSTGHRTQAARAAGRNCGASWLGPRLTCAERNRGLRASRTVVSWGQARCRRRLFDRQAKERLTWRVSSPLASIAARGFSGIRPRARARATVRCSRAPAPLFRAADRPLSGG
jgi:hypothetical protein